MVDANRWKMTKTYLESGEVVSVLTNLEKEKNIYIKLKTIFRNAKSDLLNLQ